MTYKKLYDLIWKRLHIFANNEINITDKSTDKTDETIKCK